MTEEVPITGAEGEGNEETNKGVHEIEGNEETNKGVHEIEGNEETNKGVHEIEGNEETNKGVHETEENTGSKTWEQEVDETYTDLVAELKEACENHVQRVRSQLKKMVLNPQERAERPWKDILQQDEMEQNIKSSIMMMNNFQKRQRRANHKAAFGLIVALLILLGGLAHLSRKVDDAVNSMDTTVSVMHAFASFGKIDSMLYQMEEMTKILSKISYEVKKLKRDENWKVNSNENDIHDKET